MIFRKCNKLIDDQVPISNGESPLSSDLPQGKEDGFHNRLIIEERHFCFGVLSDFSVEVLDDVCGVDQSSYFQWKIKEVGKVLPLAFHERIAFINGVST